MAYKNIINRFLISFFLLFLYFISLNHINLLFFLFTGVYLIIFYEIFSSFKKYYIFPFFYIFLSYFFLLIYYLQYFDFYIFNLMIVSIILFDSFSYFVGKLIGKNFIFKKISPKKTFEGYVGGIFFTNIFFLAFFYFNNTDLNKYSLIVLVNFIILSSIVGDLIQSFFKRKNNIKDSSRYLPGHGGFFDRFDSLIFSIIFLLLYSSL